jgi:hypothetical protein
MKMTEELDTVRQSSDRARRSDGWRGCARRIQRVRWRREASQVKGVDAVRQLRGRNLSHIGCTLGLVAGLSLGLLLALLALRFSPSVNVAFAVFAGATLLLGVVGYYVGTVATHRFAEPVEPAGRGEPGDPLR